METDRTRLKCNPSLRYPLGLCRIGGLRKLELIHLAMSGIIRIADCHVRVFLTRNSGSQR